MVLVLFGALFVNLNYLQVVAAQSLSENPLNVARQLQREYEVRRGSILASDGATELARSEETDGRLRFRRIYDQGPLYGHVTGFSSFVFGRTEVERSENDPLSGTGDPLRSIADLLADREPIGNDVITTIVPAVQLAAADALGGRRGAVVALDPRDGAVLALVSVPSYDPNLLSSFDGEAVRAARDELLGDPSAPLENRALRRFYAPGSTFKLVTAAAALDGGVTPEDTFDDPRELDLPQTQATIGNFGGGTCNGGQPITLAEALEVSCNTTFGQLALDMGPRRLVAQAEAFGFGTDLGGRLPALAPAEIPDAGTLDAPATAQSAIGQRDVRVTPMQMAAVAAAIAQGGTLYAPHLVREIQDVGGGVIDERPPTVAAQPISGATAAALRAMMLRVVESGTGTAAQIPGTAVAGKSGTAESGVEGQPPTVWFVAFAPAEAPTVAVAVVIENGGDVGDEATGGRVAAPVARATLEAALAADG